MATPLEMWKRLVYYLYRTWGNNAEDYDVRASCCWDDFNLELPEIGYSRRGITKRKRWYDIYISGDEVEKFNKNVKIIKNKKKDFVALFRFGNKEKITSNKVGDFCLIAGTFRFQKGVLKKVNIYYRTTEGITKFLADLILLRDFFTVCLTSINMKGVEVEFWFTKIYTRYFHIITFYRVCRKLWNEDVTEKLGKWAIDLLKNVKSGKREFKFCAAKRLAKSFRENCDEA
jgi:hypothetical protein